MKRIQRKRKRGWRMPPTAIYVGRPTRWGNPFDWQDCVDQWTDEAEARRIVVSDYRNWLACMYKSLWSTDRDWILENLETLRGFDLACWCPLDQACHADVLIEMLEREIKREQG